MSFIIHGIFTKTDINKFFKNISDIIDLFSGEYNNSILNYDLQTIINYTNSCNNKNKNIIEILRNCKYNAIYFKENQQFNKDTNDNMNDNKIKIYNSIIKLIKFLIKYTIKITKINKKNKKLTRINLVEEIDIKENKEEYIKIIEEKTEDFKK